MIRWATKQLQIALRWYEVVAKTVKQLRGNGATGVDEIRPGYLKALDILGLSWLTCLSNIAWTLGALPL